MRSFQRNFVRLISMVFAFACTGLVLMWPQWSTALQQEGYGTEPPNGDFETSDLYPWIGSGDVGVAEFNVLDGYGSAFLSTADFSGFHYPLSYLPAVGDICSYLESPSVYPPYDYGLTHVSFKVRYKTNELIGRDAFYVDPFHAQIKVPQGTVDLLTINTDGASWSNDRRVRTKVINYDTGRRLRNPPVMPPFRYQRDYFEMETETLAVQSKVPLKGCKPVRIRFQICDWWDSAVDSAVFVDNVEIEFKKKFRAKKCRQPVRDSVGKMETFPPRRN